MREGFQEIEDGKEQDKEGKQPWWKKCCQCSGNSKSTHIRRALISEQGPDSGSNCYLTECFGCLGMEWPKRKSGKYAISGKREAKLVGDLLRP
jgi:hypothetical protein